MPSGRRPGSGINWGRNGRDCALVTMWKPRSDRLFPLQPEKLTCKERFPLRLSELTLRKAAACHKVGGHFSNGEQMRFHKAESAFFVFIFVILAAGLVTLHAYGLLQAFAAELHTASGHRQDHLSQQAAVRDRRASGDRAVLRHFLHLSADPQAGDGRRQAARHDGFAQRPLGNAGACGADRRPDRHAEPALFRRCAEGISRGVPAHREARRADDPRPRPFQAGQRHPWP